MRNEVSSGLVKTLITKLEALSQSLEKSHIAEFIALYDKPWRLMYLNFLSGVIRGFGLAVGFSAIGALFLYALGRLATLNLPIVGEFIAEIARIVQEELTR